MKNNIEIIYFRESLVASIASDVFTFGLPAILAYLNYAYLGNSTVFQILIAVVWLISCLSRASKKHKTFTSYNEMLSYITQKAEKQALDGEA